MELLPENGDSSNFVGTLRAYAFDFKDKDQALFRCLYRLTVFLNEGDFGMDISIFDVLGPVMIGPSSSHTAGAARLARIAARIADKPFGRVTFGLHGSFARTYKGHGTDRALLAGVLGIHEDDERLSQSFELAKSRGIAWEFYEKELDGVHENSRFDYFLLPWTAKLRR